MAGAVFIIIFNFFVGLFEPCDSETFSANIPVLINCFRGVTCILPMTVGLFKYCDFRGVNKHNGLFVVNATRLWCVPELQHSLFILFRLAVSGM